MTIPEPDEDSMTYRMLLTTAAAVSSLALGAAHAEKLPAAAHAQGGMAKSAMAKNPKTKAAMAAEHSSKAAKAAKAPARATAKAAKTKSPKS